MVEKRIARRRGTARRLCHALCRPLCKPFSQRLGRARRRLVATLFNIFTARAHRTIIFELKWLDLKLLLDELLDVGHHAGVIARHERHSQARRAGTAGTADAVHVVFGVKGHVEVEDCGQVGDVQTPRCHIGGYQQVDFTRLERRQGLQTFVLTLVAMQRLRAQAVTLERTRQTRSAQL